jgi:aminoglycoside phosphotransferase (APT) family kinase protein
MELSLVAAISARLGVDPARLTMLAGRDGRIVCRVSRDEGGLVAKASDRVNDFDEEARAMESLAGMGIPVSQVVMLEDGPPAMLVSRWLDGVPVSADSGADVWREVGRILRQIHNVAAKPPFSSHPTILAWIEHWYGLVMAWWSETGGLDPVSWNVADGWMAAVSQVLAGREGCLMLFDGRPEHFLVGANGRVRLIDVADLQPGEAAMDLAVLELDAPGILPAVLDGYDATAEEREVFGVLVPFLVFLRALSGAEWQGRMVGNSEESARYLAKASTMLRDRAERQ